VTGEPTSRTLASVAVVADPETLFGNTIGIYTNNHESVSGSYGEHDVYKGKDAPGNIEFFAPGGALGFTAGCGIRIGGENNWGHPQKALNLAIRGKYGNDDITYDLFPGSGIPIHTALTLRDGGDNWNKDMLRDGLFPKLAEGQLNVDTADYRPAIVFINGTYFGIHDVRQRWDETWFAQKYQVSADKIDHLLYGHVTSSSTTLGAEKGTTDGWLDLLAFLNTADLTTETNWAYVESKIDLDSFIDFVVSESYGNNSQRHRQPERSHHHLRHLHPVGRNGHWRHPRRQHQWHHLAVDDAAGDGRRPVERHHCVLPLGQFADGRDRQSGRRPAFCRPGGAELSVAAQLARDQRRGPGPCPRPRPHGRRHGCPLRVQPVPLPLHHR